MAPSSIAPGVVKSGALFSCVTTELYKYVQFYFMHVVQLRAEWAACVVVPLSLPWATGRRNTSGFKSLQVGHRSLSRTLVEILCVQPHRQCLHAAFLPFCLGHKHLCCCENSGNKFPSSLVYFKDRFKTWTVSKPSDGFKTGRTALSPARRLKNGPRRLVVLAWFELISHLQVDACSEKASTYARSDH